MTHAIWRGSADRQRIGPCGVLTTRPGGPWHEPAILAPGIRDSSISLNALTPSTNITAMAAAVTSAVTAGSDSRRGSRVTSQAPSSEMAPSAGT